MFPLYDLNPHRRFPWFTLLIIVANVGVTVWTTTLTRDDATALVVHYGFVPQRITQLRAGKPVTVRVPQIDRLGREIQGAPKQQFRLPADPSAVYLTFLTTMFLHGGWLHVLMNMWMLWIYGNNIEDRLGHFMFVCYYILGGLVATLVQWSLDMNSTTPMIGASGAVAAVLGGYAITYPTAKVRTLVLVPIPLIFDLPALVVLGIWFMLEMFSGFMMIGGGMVQQVAYGAHVGGFLAGLVLMPFMSLGASPPGADWSQEADEMFRFDDPRST
jgi:membrane associated rhomboid family serine protease